MYQIHRSIDISFAHHIRGHSGACINIHGHTWKFEVALQATTLDKEGFVVDFGVLKKLVLEPCHQLLDHSLAVGQATYEEIDKSLETLGEKLLSSRLTVLGTNPGVTYSPYREESLNSAFNKYPGDMKICVFPFAPTSERLARWLYELAEQKIGSDRVTVSFARIYETLHPVESVAEYRP